MSVDILTLKKLAEKMRMDADQKTGVNFVGLYSIADIIETAIGAPVYWPSHVAALDEAQSAFQGNPSARLGFINGVRWAVEHYQPSEVVKERFR